MDRKKVFLIVQSALCLLVAVFLIIAVIAVYREGSAIKAANPLEWIFSREKAAERLRPIAPLLFVAVGLTAGGLILGVKDEKGLQPVKSGRVEHKDFSGAKMLRIGLLIAAVCLLFAGVLNGSARDVFGKAVKICTECVGLG